MIVIVNYTHNQVSYKIKLRRVRDNEYNDIMNTMI